MTDEERIAYRAMQKRLFTPRPDRQTPEGLERLAEQWDEVIREARRDPLRKDPSCRAVYEQRIQNYERCAAALRTALRVQAGGAAAEPWTGFSEAARASFPATAEMMARLEKRLLDGKVFDPDFHELSKRVRPLVEELAALRGAAGETPEWRPIESAPKDGTRILFWNGDAVAGGSWYEDENSEPPEPRWCADGCVGNRPTHWMPLPPAPSHESESRPAQETK